MLDKKQFLLFLLAGISASIIGFKGGFQITEILSIAGLLFAAWQTLIGISSARESQINKIIEASDKRDFYHEQELSKLIIALADVQNKIEYHTNQPGHQIMVEQILQIKDTLSDLRAIVAVLSRQGEIALKMEKMQNEINTLKEKI